MASRTINAWLVYRASDGSLRTFSRTALPRLAWDEIAWRINLTVPEPWGRSAGEIAISLPDSPPAEVVVTEIATPA